MRVGVAEQQGHLEEEEARSPDRGRASEPGQNDLGDDRLDLKQEEGAAEDRDRITQRVQEPRSAGRCPRGSLSGLETTYKLAIRPSAVTSNVSTLYGLPASNRMTPSRRSRLRNAR